MHVLYNISFDSFVWFVVLVLMIGVDCVAAVGTEHGKRELACTTQQVSSRWNPTPEQLRTLEELYRRGTRTPTADQIQHITAQLRRFGKIEGKNVFYITA